MRPRVQKMMMCKRVNRKKKRVKRKEKVKREREREKRASFYAKASDVKSTFYANQACFNTNELDESLPSVVVFLLQEYEDECA